MSVSQMLLLSTANMSVLGTGREQGSCCAACLPRMMIESFMIFRGVWPCRSRVDEANVKKGSRSTPSWQRNLRDGTVTHAPSSVR